MKWVLTAAIVSSLTTLASAKVIGVAPHQEFQYKPDEHGKWACLNHPEIILDWSQVNDDFCDCPDGSDEPGTSACPNGQFYCENKGHIAGYIKSSLVNDGACDYAKCCDGSDEWNTPVDCPSKCEEINAEYQKELKLKEETRKIGLEKAQKTVKAAKRITDKLNGDLVSKQAIVDFLAKELKAKKQDLEMLQGSDDQTVLLAQNEIKNILESIKTQVNEKFDAFTSSTFSLNSLTKILDALVQTFNENLKDAAVKETVDNYLAHLEKFKSQYSDEKSETFQSFDSVKASILEKLGSLDVSTPASEIKSVFDGVSETLQTELSKHNSITERANDLDVMLNNLINNYNPNFNDPNVKEAVNSFQDFAVNKEVSNIVSEETISWFKEQIEKLQNLVSSLPKETPKEAKPAKDSSSKSKKNEIPIWEKVKFRYRVMINEFLGINNKEQYKIQPYVPKQSKGELETAVDELSKEHDDLVKSIQSIKNELAREFGPNDILRPLKDISIKGHIGEYDYDLFFIGDVNQKGHGSNVKIGSFSSVEVKDISETEHQLVLKYENGARCWNGPLRQAIVTIACGSENELVAVTEPEKCEYHFRVNAPIGCKLPAFADS